MATVEWEDDVLAAGVCIGAWPAVVEAIRRRTDLPVEIIETVLTANSEALKWAHGIDGRDSGTAKEGE